MIDCRECRLSLREGTPFREVKGDNHSGVTGIPESGTFLVPSPPSSGERARVRGLIHARLPHPASPPRTGERGKTGMPVTPQSFLLQTWV